MTEPVATGLFEEGAGRARLIGSRCTSCDTLYFPTPSSCRNPRCHDKILTRVLLPERGTLVSFTIQHYQPPPMFRMDEWAPYAIGLVDLGEGVEVMGMLTGVDIAAITMGMPVRLVIEPLFTDPERGVVTTYKFAPDHEGKRS